MVDVLVFLFVDKTLMLKFNLIHLALKQKHKFKYKWQKFIENQIKLSIQ